MGKRNQATKSLIGLRGARLSRRLTLRGIRSDCQPPSGVPWSFRAAPCTGGAPLPWLGSGAEESTCVHAGKGPAGKPGSGTKQSWTRLWRKSDIRGRYCPAEAKESLGSNHASAWKCVCATPQRVGRCDRGKKKLLENVFCNQVSAKRMLFSKRGMARASESRHLTLLRGLKKGSGLPSEKRSRVALKGVKGCVCKADGQRFGSFNRSLKFIHVIACRIRMTCSVKHEVIETQTLPTPHVRAQLNPADASQWESARA